jgi:hypothetical protein
MKNSSSEPRSPKNRILGGACILAIAVLTLTFLSNAVAEEEPPSLRIDAGDSIVFIGNTFAERMHLFGYFETFLHCKFPEHKLKVRNMGWSADELTLKPRPVGFGDRHRYFEREEVDLIFACFGMNESFQGPGGLEKFKGDFAALIEDLQGHQYNGEAAPRIVLVSPIAHENLGGLLPDGKEHNENLRLYTSAMAGIAKQSELPFVDLFSPTLERAKTQPETHLTFNGIHPTSYGYWWTSQVMARSLGLIGEVPAPQAGGGDAGTAEKLRRAVYDKNYSFFFHWRPPNMEYIHGRRKDLPGAERLPEEHKQLYNIIGQLDQMIWQTSKSKPEQVWQQLPPSKPLWAATPEFEGVTVPEIGPVRLTRREEDLPRMILEHQEALKKFELPEGYKLNLFAAEGRFTVANPMAIKFDARGRLWVANTPTWPHPLPGKQPEDSIVILEDTDNDGVADKETVFMDHLNMIHGFAFGDGGVYIAQTPHTIHVKDTDGDDRADQFRMLLHGFGGEDVEHSINNHTWGPDGSLYFMEGTFFHTQVETPYGPERALDGAVFRYNQRRQKFEVYVTYGFANPWGQVWDRWGQPTILDASGHNFYNMDLLAANFVYPTSRHGQRSFAVGERAAGGGINLIRTRQFPDAVQGRFLSSQICGTFRGLAWWEIQEDGTTYKVERVVPELLVSKDPHMGPLGTTVGPDGALYVIDFHTPLAENTSQPKRFKGRDHMHGRIWRISHKDRPLLKPPTIVGEPAGKLLDLLKSYENSTRHFARRELQERDPDQLIPHLIKWIAALEPSDANHDLYLLEALWIYQGLDTVEPQLLKRLLAAKDHRIRASATRVLRFWQGDIEGSQDLLSELIEDEHIRVRLQALLALGFSPSDQARNIALKVTKHPMDHGLQMVLDNTIDYWERAKKLR